DERVRRRSQCLRDRTGSRRAVAAHQLVRVLARRSLAASEGSRRMNSLSKSSAMVPTVSPDNSRAEPVQPYLRTESLGLRYSDKCALEDVTLSVARRRITALVGPSGCGKTSFLHCLNRLTDLIPGCRVSGRLCVGELDVFNSNTD